MFFNSLDKKLKKSFGMLNPVLRDQVFPNGEKEFVYVGTMLNFLFKGREITQLILIYTYYSLEMGNAYKTYEYAIKKTENLLDRDDTITLIGLVMLNKTSVKNFNANPVEEVNRYKGYAKEYIDTVTTINQNKEKFATKKENVGAVNNPILVDGIKGAHKYIESIDFASVNEVKYWKSTSLSLTDDETKIDYIIDEYTIVDEKTKEEIAKLWFNIYGIESCVIAPEHLKFKK